MKIAFRYFSATGNTRRVAEEIASRLSALGAEVDLKDITTPQARQAKPDMTQYQAAVFGSPIHSMRAPRLVRDWLGGLQGEGRPCATFFTYGGFRVAPTHFDTRRILQERCFKVVATAEFLGAHTFNLGGWQAMAGRPDDGDLAIARAYAEKIYERFAAGDTAIAESLDPGAYTDEQLNQFESFRFKVLTTLPTRQGQECQMCLLCEEECPSGAMDAEKGEADPAKCICCLRCVQICPDEALAVNDLREAFKNKMNMDKETAETLAKKKSRMYL